MDKRRNDQGKFMQVYEEAMSKTAVCVRFPLSVHSLLKSMPDKSNFIRDAVIDRMAAEGLLEQTDNTDEAKP